MDRFQAKAPSKCVLTSYLWSSILTSNSPSKEAPYHLQMRSLSLRIAVYSSLLWTAVLFQSIDSSSYPQSFHVIFQIKLYCTFFLIGPLYYFLPMKSLCEKFYVHMFDKIMKSRHCPNIEVQYWNTFQIASLPKGDTS